MGDTTLDHAPPSRVGGYALGRLLGEGGMGRVFAATDPALGRPVAVKVMRPELAAKPDARQRFLREARAAAAVSHDHVVRIYQVGEDDGVPFLAMELLDGQSLADRLAAGPLPVAEVVRIGREAAAWLAAAHAAGLIHRDIKPANLWLEAPAGRVKLLDFGLARSVADPALTASGEVLGTPAYMAPEQAAGRPVDHRADLFSLGCVLYHAATGRRPFDGPDAMSILHSLANHIPPPAEAVNPAVPWSLAELLGRMMAREPHARPATAAGVADQFMQLPLRPAGGSGDDWRRYRLIGLLREMDSVVRQQEFRRTRPADVVSLSVLGGTTGLAAFATYEAYATSRTVFGPFVIVPLLVTLVGFFGWRAWRLQMHLTRLTHQLLAEYPVETADWYEPGTPLDPHVVRSLLEMAEKR